MPTFVRPEGHHRGVVALTKDFSNRLIQIPHQCDLFDEWRCFSMSSRSFTPKIATACPCPLTSASAVLTEPRSNNYRPIFQHKQGDGSSAAMPRRVGERVWDSYCTF